MRTGYEGGLWGADGSTPEDHERAFERAQKETHEAIKAAHAAALVAIANDEAYVEPLTLAILNVGAVELPQHEYDNVLKSEIARVKRAIEEVKPDFWMSGYALKVWVARANGLF